MRSKIIRIRIRDIIAFILYFFCVIRVLEFFGVPHWVEYGMDIAVVILLIRLISINRIMSCLNNPLIILQSIFIFMGIVVALFNQTSIPLILWSVRNYGRFIIFFAACVFFLKLEDYRHIFSKLDKLFIVNAVLTLVEYFVLKYRSDDIGGLFALSSTKNGDLNMFLVIMTIYYVIRWDNKKISTFHLGATLILDVLICVLAEIKFFFIELAFLFLLILLVNQLIIQKRLPSLKWIHMGSVLVVVLISGANFLARLYPHWVDFFSIRNIITEASRKGGYTNSWDINRLTFVSGINERIFNRSILPRIIGTGLGTSDFSNVTESLVSMFYREYQLLHYYYFSSSWVYIEGGLIGLILYFSSFGMCIKDGLKKMKDSFSKDGYDMAYISMISAFFALFQCVYNQSMRVPSAYLMYFSLAYTYSVYSET